MDFTTLAVAVVGGLVLLATYAFIFGVRKPGPYLTHVYWFGMDPQVVKVLVVFQVLAAIGFCLAVTSWIVQPPIGGVMGAPWAVPVTLAILLATAIAWPLALYHDRRWLVVLSLVGTAVCTILLLAGSIEEVSPRWWVVLGFLLLGLVTVLADAVVWNANYIRVSA